MGLVLRSRILLIIGLILTVGCSPKVIKMDLATKESLNRASQITLIHYEPSSFEVPPSQMGMMFGAIGAAVAGLAAESRGQQMVQQYDLRDPILHVKERFAARVLSDFANIKLTDISEPFKDDDIDDMKEKFVEGNILDFQTIRWGVVGQPFSGNSYIKYQGRVRLIDVHNASVLWQGVCDLEDRDLYTMPDSTERNSSEGNILRAKFENLSGQCLERLISQFSAVDPAE